MFLNHFTSRIDHLAVNLILTRTRSDLLTTLVNRTGEGDFWDNQVVSKYSIRTLKRLTNHTSLQVARIVECVDNSREYAVFHRYKLHILY